MPIIEPARSGAPLTQGDLLSGVALFATKGSWDEKGGQAAVVKSELCLVLSRPCVAAHKKHVVVAAVVKFPVSKFLVSTGPAGGRQKETSHPTNPGSARRGGGAD